MKTLITVLILSFAIFAASQGTPPISSGSSGCPSGCGYCSSWNTPNVTYCSSCISGFQAASPPTCNPISIANCITLANTSTCAQCASGYFVSSGSCAACGTGATTCTSSTNALTCLAGYSLSSGACTPCLNSATPPTSISGCVECDPIGNNACIYCGFGQSNAAGTATTCAAQTTIPNCYSTSGTACTQCNPGFAPSAIASSNVYAGCVAGSIPNCAIYNWTTGSSAICARCNLGYTVSNGACVLCSAITPSTTCSACGAGAYLVSATAGCSTCSANCLTCTNGTCTSCSPGYYIGQNGLCNAGNTTVQNCLVANGTGLCVGCGPGFTLSSPLNCLTCPSNCLNCSSASSCITCSSNYTLNSTGACISLATNNKKGSILTPSFILLGYVFYHLL